MIHVRAFIPQQLLNNTIVRGRERERERERTSSCARASERGQLLARLLATCLVIDGCLLCSRGPCGGRQALAWPGGACSEVALVA